MYGIGIFELFLILLVLLLFMNPSEIFGMFRKLGVWYRKVRLMEEDLKKSWDSGLTGGQDDTFGFDTDESGKEGENL